jgi:PAS domain S-box-containing protein
VNKVNKSLYTSDEMMDRFRKAAEKIITDNGSHQDVHLSQKEIKELLQQIQIQHIELEMQNDELKISNEQAELQRQKFAGLYDLAPVGYLILDGVGTVTEINTTACIMLEVPKRNTLNRRFQTFINANDSDAFYIFLKRVLSSNTRQSCQLNLITPGGNSLYAQIEGIAVISKVRTECYITIIDITERKQAELKLQETKERLEMALDASVAGTWHIDLRTEQISLDNFSCEIYGLSTNKSTQSIDSFLTMMHPDDRRKASKRFAEAISHKRDLDVEYRIIKPDEFVSFISARGHVIENSDQALYFVGILMDITDRKELEREAIRLQEEHQRTIMTTVFRTQENERKRISEALHDSVSQLLYGIKLKLQDYKRSDKDGKVYAELNTLIEQAVEETRDISFELAPSILTDFGLPISLEEMAKRLNSDKLTIRTKISGMNKRFDLNKELNIFRIIQELVNNAIKHAKATELKIELNCKNNILDITVSDNGIGFDTASMLSASGSGLHSIKNRLDLFDGSMNIQSTDGSGTTVNIVFKDIV